MNPITEKKIKVIQSALGVKDDGVWGPVSQRALDLLVRPNGVVYAGKASSFADPKDVARFRLCKMKGGTDEECLKVGDNGRGCWGDDTTTETPACALTPEDIIRRWGDAGGDTHAERARNGHNKLVQVDANGTRVICVLRDIKGHMNEAIIDLNPAACKALGVTPPIMVSCNWKWVS